VAAAEPSGGAPPDPTAVPAVPTALDAARFGADLLAHTGVLAGLAGQPDLSTPIPTCPEWTMRELCIHVGRAHRWAGELTRTRSAQNIPFRSVPDGRFPDTPDERAQWLRAGAQRLAEATSEAAGEPVWTFTGIRPAIFWARRMAHETAVHRADADLAAGQRTELDPELAADGIDEWLTELAVPGGRAGGQALAGLPEGRSLHVHVHDQGAGGEWTLRSAGGQVSVERGHAKADAALRGPASAVMLVLMRRQRPSDPGVEVLGDPAVLDTWLEKVTF
jgi:uncharacterized protein (TIGR03083 family)